MAFGRGLHIGLKGVFAAYCTIKWKKGTQKWTLRMNLYLDTWGSGQNHGLLLG